MVAFFDTNILVYAFSSANADEARKVAIAQGILSEHVVRRTARISAQVLNEFVSAASRKGNPPLSWQRIADVVETFRDIPTVPVDATLVGAALRRVEQSRLSYWDALIVEAALRTDATILYTEDLHPGTRYGALAVQNPFLA